MKNYVLLRCDSERLDNDGQPYKDLYLAWTHDNKKYFVRIRPCFAVDFSKLYAEAVDCESADNLEKYL